MQKYLLLSVCYFKDIAKYQLDVWQAMHREPSGAFFQAAQQAWILFLCYRGLDRVKIYNLTKWGNEPPFKYLAENWLRSYRYGHYEALENHINGHWTFERRK